MLNAILILTPSDNKDKPNKTIKQVEGSGNQYYPHHTKEAIKVKVRPITEDDYITFFKSLGLKPYNINKELEELILSNLSHFTNFTVANSYTRINGKWHYKLFYTVI